VEAPLVVVLNPSSGTRGAGIPARVSALCQAAGRTAEITTAPDVEALCRAVEDAIASRAGAIVVGGGDGTLSCVAGLLAGHDIPLGVLPLGTLNHFARDLGIPQELDAAVQVVLAGHSERIDVGEVNGRVFLNNSSLGLYPLIVRLREQHPVRGPAKWAVALWATMREIRLHREIAVRIKVEGEVLVHRTPIVFVGNNEYRAAGLEMGTRASLRGGRLAIYVVKAGGRRHVLRLAWKMLTSREHDELEVLLAEAATIEPSGPRVHLAVDGEVAELRPPLEYRIRPAALRVLVPDPLPELP
jgi:YegS/Rv2252/BmrU family lipid kinase